jgi:hypothetical protein
MAAHTDPCETQHAGSQVSNPAHATNVELKFFRACIPENNAIVLLAGDGTQCVAMQGWAQPAVGYVEPKWRRNMELGLCIEEYRHPLKSIAQACAVHAQRATHRLNTVNGPS